MIVRQLEDEWIVIEQAEHARHAGQLAEAWAAGHLAGGALSPGLITATQLHDIGWTEPDSLPRVDPDTGGPLHFTKVRDDRHADFYTAGIRRVAEADAYAGYLVSLHATGIYSGRFGWNGLRSIAWDSVGERGKRLLDDQAAFRSQLAVRVAEQRSGVLEFERVCRDYMLLQTFDYLSLFVCAGLESTGCGPVPEGSHGWRDLRLTRTGTFGAAVDPFPFPGARIELEVACRRLPAGRFSGDAELRQSLATTPASRCVTWFERA
jgi:hypothetical protein